MATIFPAFPAPAASRAAGANTPAAAAGQTGTAGRASAAQATSGGGIAENFDSFLKLLTTQLQNQSPLDPLNTNEFTQQLVQFASVEQQLKQNATLQSLLVSSQASAAATVASFIGLTIRADGATAPLTGGAATWSLEAPRASPTATITIRDSSNKVVATRTQALKAGENSFTWDGKMTSGAKAPDGDYSISVQANDVAGQTMKVGTQVQGTVSGADLSGDMPVLLIGSVRVPLGSVRSINRTPPTLPPTTPTTPIP